MMVITTIKWHASNNPDTIWNRLAERLGREPAEAEAAEEVRSILRGEPVEVRDTSGEDA